MTAPRILVVEDERIVALHLRQQLTALGYDVPGTVSTGEHALRRIADAPPDLVLMDINLKGRMDGIDTAAAIPSTYNIPVIYLTAYSAEATLARAAATRPHGYLLKPFSERELHAMIQMTLARCRAERASRADQEIRQQARKMDALCRLAGGVADEVNDLLTALYGQLEVLGGHAIGAPALAGPVHDAFGAAIEKERLIRRLLDFSGRRELIPAPVSLNDLVAKVADQLRHTVGDAVRVHCHVAKDIWNAWIDAGQLARVMSYLAVNGREAMPDGGNLTIEAHNASFIGDASVRRDAGLEQDNVVEQGGETATRYVLLSVTDTGTGMTEQVIERAFEPFFTTKAPDGGTGLGLSLVFAFIRQSRGHVMIDSDIQRGTTVRLYLPAAMNQAAEVGPPLPAGNKAAGNGGTERGTDAVSIQVCAEKSRHAAASARQRRARAPADGGASPVLWRKAENALFASVLVRPGRLRYRLIVEPLPRRDGWDWAVWRPDEAKETSRHGRASSVVSAMSAAEATAKHWAEFDPGD